MIRPFSSPVLNSQGGLTEGQLKDLEGKGTAALGEATGPLVDCLANEYQQVKVLGDNAIHTC